MEGLEEGLQHMYCTVCINLLRTVHIEASNYLVGYLTQPGERISEGVIAGNTSSSLSLSNHY